MLGLPLDTGRQRRLSISSIEDNDIDSGSTNLSNFRAVRCYRRTEKDHPQTEPEDRQTRIDSQEAAC